jgi:tyrosine-protein phosphatase YwqE
VHVLATQQYPQPTQGQVTISRIIGLTGKASFPLKKFIAGLIYRQPTDFTRGNMESQATRIFLVKKANACLNGALEIRGRKDRA